MLRPWRQLAITFLVGLSLVAAPCKHCQPKVEPQVPASGHDCCPKPKPAPAPAPTDSCQWQPAAYDAVETKAGVYVDTPAIVPALTVTTMQPALPNPVWLPALPPPPVQSPPAVLRI